MAVKYETSFRQRVKGFRRRPSLSGESFLKLRSTQKQKKEQQRKEHHYYDEVLKINATFGLNILARCNYVNVKTRGVKNNSYFYNITESFLLFTVQNKVAYFAKLSSAVKSICIFLKGDWL